MQRPPNKSLASEFSAGLMAAMILIAPAASPPTIAAGINTAA